MSFKSKCIHTNYLGECPLEDKKCKDIECPLGEEKVLQLHEDYTSKEKDLKSIFSRPHDMISKILKSRKFKNLNRWRQDRINEWKYLKSFSPKQLNIIDQIYKTVCAIALTINIHIITKNLIASLVIAHILKGV